MPTRARRNVSAARRCGPSQGDLVRVEPDVMRQLARHGVEIARAAGAVYADVRLTRTITQQLLFPQDQVVGGIVSSDDEALAVGVRVQVEGSWGFAASPYWDAEELTVLAREAVAQARANARAQPSIKGHSEALAPTPVATGTWMTPGIDPFTISIEEKIDCMDAWRNAVTERTGVGRVARPWLDPFRPQMNFLRQDRVFASTEGTNIAQTCFVSSGDFPLQVFPSPGAMAAGQAIQVAATGLDLQGKGWEIFTDAALPAQIPALVEHATQQHDIPVKPAELGRYDVVFDATTTARLVDLTIGVATQLDRALGYEANAAGTSYLGPDPLSFLETFQVGSPLITVTANRSLSGGLATVHWDDEGVIPVEFPLVHQGVLVDYQTTREQAQWLAPWYQQHSVPVRSHGCAAADSALAMTMQHMPNLRLEPAANATTFDTLVAGTPRGVAVTGGLVFIDVQAKTGVVWGTMREIVQGKLGASLVGAKISFNTTEFWNSVIALGGPSSVERAAAQNTKGQPAQVLWHTVEAVPMAVKNVAVIRGAGR